MCIMRKWYGLDLLPVTTLLSSFSSGFLLLLISCFVIKTRWKSMRNLWLRIIQYLISRNWHHMLHQILSLFTFSYPLLPHLNHNCVCCILYFIQAVFLSVFFSGKSSKQRYFVVSYFLYCGDLSNDEGGSKFTASVCQIRRSKEQGSLLSLFFSLFIFWKVQIAFAWWSSRTLPWASALWAVTSDIHVLTCSLFGCVWPSFHMGSVTLGHVCIFINSLDWTDIWPVFLAWP